MMSISKKRATALALVTFGLVLTLAASNGYGQPRAVAPFDAQQARDHQEAWANHLDIPVEKTGAFGMEFVLIPAGEFMMGSPGSEDGPRRAAERPQRSVRITRAFYLGKYPVTQAQWAAVMGNTPSYFRGPTRPVESVSWTDCQDFLLRLNATVEDQDVEFRLPTEAEWEYACRAGTTTLYSFGDDLSELGQYAWHGLNSGGRTHPVGLKKPNAWGLYDMHGNVWEWCQDWFGRAYYADAPVENPLGPESGRRRVLRGGSWSYGGYPYYYRSAARYFGTPEVRRLNIDGFRVVRTLPP